MCMAELLEGGVMPTKQLRIGAGLSIPLDLATEAIAILGKRGGGKTNTAVVLVEEMAGAGIPVVVVDTVGVWWGIRTSADGKGDGLPFVIFGGEHADVPLEEKSGQIIADAILDHGISAVVDTSGLSKAAARRFLFAFVTRIYMRKASDRSPLHVVFDEADELAPQRPTPEGAPLLGAMQDFVRRGRVRGLGSTLVTQRPAVLNKDILTQVEILIAMRMTGPHDIKAIDEWTRQNSDEDQAAQVKQTLASLPTGTGWLWSPQWLELLVQVKVRPRRTFDSSATPKVGQVRIEPKKRAEIDLAKLGADIQATVERAKSEDPKAMRSELDRLRRELARATSTSPAEPQVQRVEVPVEVRVEVPAVSAADQKALGEAAAALRTAIAPMLELLERIEAGIASASSVRQADTRPRPPASDRAPIQSAPAQSASPRPAAPRALSDEGSSAPDAKLPTGAHRMVQALGRMAPLRLTKSQWGTVSGLKTSGGTWSTYLSSIRRRGFIDESPAGYTLTDAGFDYLGGRPEPMTAAELQDHYRSILPAGAVKMLNALLDAHPEGLTKQELGDAAEIATTGGTFSTYLSKLVRNGLAERRGELIVATDVLVHGAEM